MDEDMFNAIVKNLRRQVVEALENVELSAAMQDVNELRSEIIRETNERLNDLQMVCSRLCCTSKELVQLVMSGLQYLCGPTPYHQRRYTFSVITDIGVSREANRTRKFSITEQSTRYCCYNADKFGGEITYVKPAWESKDKPLIGGPFEGMSDGDLFRKLLDDINEDINTQWTAKTYYIFGLLASEFAYVGMRNNGEVADKCRQVLNLNTKTQVVYTAFAKDWEHFLKLRADNVSGKAHENIQIIAKKIKNIIENF